MFGMFVDSMVSSPVSYTKSAALGSVALSLIRKGMASLVSFMTQN